MASDRAATDRRRDVKRVLVTALVINLTMTGLKLLIGLLSGSLAVIADAMHSATDALSSLMGLITNGLSDPRPDRDHPYGHDKYEGVGALAIAGFILFTAIEILIKGGERLVEGVPELKINSIELLLLLVVLVFNLGLAFYERREGRRLQSQLLLADARHTTTDIWTTVIVLVGLTGAKLLEVNWLDVALALPLAVLLINVCWQVIRSNLPWLVDHIAIAPEAIHEQAMGVPGVLNCHDIASRGVLGQRVFVDMHMVVDTDHLPTAHGITEQAFYERREGRRLQSQLLLADARHTTTDIWTTVIVLVGLTGAKLLEVNWLDVALALPLAVLLINVCWQVIRSNLPWLVDHIAIAPEAIHEQAMGVPGVLNCHDIASRGVLGQRVFVDMHMVVDTDHLPTAHGITEQVEERLEKRFGPVRCTIHLEPKDYAEQAITFRGTHG